MGDSNTLANSIRKNFIFEIWKITNEFVHNET
jgi:hypothetical protein